VGKSDKDLGILMALMQRFENFRMPAALKLKEKVDRGEVLNDRDIQFLKRVEADAMKLQPILDRNPQYQELAARAIKLFSEITKKGLENEEKSHT